MSDTLPNLSLCLIVRDERANLSRCLESAAPIADQIVVVDTGSTDGTPELATSLGAEVFRFPWRADFAAARNVSLERARGRWILVLDADEYLPPRSVEALRKLTATPADRAFHLLNKSSTDSGKTGMVGKIVRLFPNRADVRYEWPAHEQVVSSLNRAGIPILDSDIEIIHTGYSDPETNRRKQARNLEILQAHLAANPDADTMVFFLTAGALLDLGRLDAALETYRACASRSVEGSEIHEASRVRQATCLSKLHRHREALALAPSSNPATWHPEFLVQLGQCALAVGEFEKGLQWLHTAIAAPFQPSIPAYDPVKTKARALRHISTVLEKSDMPRAVEMLRLAVDCIKTGREPRLEEVLSIEQAP